MAVETLFQVQLSDLAFATRVARGIPGQPPVDPKNCGPASAWLLGIINDQEVADMTRAMRGWSLAFWSAALDRRFPNFVHAPHTQDLTQETIERVGRNIANGAATLMLSQDTRDIGHYYVLSKSDMGLLQLFDVQRNEYIQTAPAIFNHIRMVYHGGAIGQPLKLTLFGQTARPGVVIPRAPPAVAAAPYQFGPRALGERNAAFLRALEAVEAHPAGDVVNANIADIPEERAPGVPHADRGPGDMEVESPPAPQNRWADFAAIGNRRGGSTRHRTSLPTRRAGRSSSSSKRNYTHRRRALRTGKGGYRPTKTGRKV